MSQHHRCELIHYATQKKIKFVHRNDPTPQLRHSKYPCWLFATVYYTVVIKIPQNELQAGWWFQPLWKMLVKWDYCFQYREK